MFYGSSTFVSWKKFALFISLSSDKLWIFWLLRDVLGHYSNALHHCKLSNHWFLARHHPSYLWIRFGGHCTKQTQWSNLFNDHYIIMNDIWPLLKYAQPWVALILPIFHIRFFRYINQNDCVARNQHVSCFACKWVYGRLFWMCIMYIVRIFVVYFPPFFRLQNQSASPVYAN